MYTCMNTVYSICEINTGALGFANIPGTEGRVLGGPGVWVRTSLFLVCKMVSDDPWGVILKRTHM